MRGTGRGRGDEATSNGDVARLQSIHEAVSGAPVECELGESACDRLRHRGRDGAVERTDRPRADGAVLRIATCHGDLVAGVSVAGHRRRAGSNGASAGLLAPSAIEASSGPKSIAMSDRSERIVHTSANIT